MKLSSALQRSLPKPSLASAYRRTKPRAWTLEEDTRCPTRLPNTATAREIAQKDRTVHQTSQGSYCTWCNAGWVGKDSSGRASSSLCKPRTEDQPTTYIPFTEFRPRPALELTARHDRRWVPSVLAYDTLQYKGRMLFRTGGVEGGNGAPASVSAVSEQDNMKRLGNGFRGLT